MSKEKRARQKENRQQRQAAEARARSMAKWGRRLRVWPALIGLVVIALWLASRGGTEETAAEVPNDYAGFRAQVTACEGTRPAERVEMTFDAPEELGLSGTVSAIIDTSCGSVEFLLDAEAAPQSVNSFVFLADQGYFDGTACHRLVIGFVLQCGDPSATGTGNPGYTVPDELPAADFEYSNGVVAMANAGPDTTGSQFFLVIGDAGLGPDFSVIGTFTDPDNVLAALAEVPLGTRAVEQSVPLETIYINTVTVAR